MTPAHLLRSVYGLARREIVLIAILLGISLPLWLFAHIAEEVGEGDTRAFDTAILLALRTHDHHDPIGPAWFELAVTDVTALGGFAVLTLVTLIVIGFVIVRGKPAAALLIAASVLGGTLLSESLKVGFARPRPDLVAHVVEATSASFPSGHATLSAAVYLTLGVMLARTQEAWRVRIYVLSVAIALTLMIGVSRIYLGVHWPTDVLAGWCLGAAWALLCSAVANWIGARK
ncbi:MAG: phosphatase PAP2 family protein [Pseudomonadota bacterium]